MATNITIGTEVLGPLGGQYILTSVSEETVGLTHFSTLYDEKVMSVEYFNNKGYKVIKQTKTRPIFRMKGLE